MTADKETTRSYAVIVAAGSGRRCPGPRAKQFLELAGKPLYLWSVLAFARVPQIRGIILVGPGNDETARSKMQRETRNIAKLLDVVPGGATRTESMARGVAALDLKVATANNDPVLIHDGARPLVTPELIGRVIAETGPGRIAIPVTTPTATVKRLAGEIILESLPRESIGLAQTPQGVPSSLLRRALEHHLAMPPENRRATDEGSLIETLPTELRQDIVMVAVHGEPRNLKITFPEDLKRAETLLVRNPESPEANPEPPVYATGFGYDVHAFAAERKLVLGGIEIADHTGLAGHSDADVLIHALVDAILGAIGEGDIGRLFPDHDPTYKDMCSLRFLEKAMALTRGKGRQLLAADITVVAQAPKLAPHIPLMQERLREVLGPCQLNLKATTTEGLGFTGRREGIAAYAVVTVAAS